MKHVIICLLAIALIAGAQTKKKSTKEQKTKQSQASALKSNRDSLSYALGFNIATRIMTDFAKNEIPVSAEMFSKGFTDMFTGNRSDLSDSATQTILMNFQMEMQKKQQEAANDYKERVEQNKAAGEAFLAANAKKDSVKTTASGLQYKVIREGKGSTPTDSSTVTVNYRGRLIDGTVFDESYGRGEPLVIKVNQVIKGWTEGLQLMKVGGKCEFYIPSDLAYGEQGAGQMILPNSALIFEVELLGVK